MYDIVIIAGQSNAEGNGRGLDKEKLKPIDGVMQLVDINSVGIVEDENGGVKVNCVFPINCRIETCVERIAANFALPFAKEYIEKGLLKKGRKLLFVKAAVGGTGFTKKQWGLGNPLYKRLCEMTEFALNAERGSKIVAFLWHQGEHDAYEGQNKPIEELGRYYYDNLKEMLLDYRYKYGDMPIITGGFVPNWKDDFDYAIKVEEATKKVCEDIKNAAFVPSNGLISNNQFDHSGDMIHFCRKSIDERTKRYFDAYCKLKKS